MDNKVSGKPASSDEITLFAMMGNALIIIQAMEESLSLSITVKKDIGYRQVSQAEANKLLEKRRKLTLGQAMKDVVEHKLYDDDLQKTLTTFIKDRNWLVHKSIEDFYIPDKKEEFIKRVISIMHDVFNIKSKIDDDCIIFAESKGLDMSVVRQQMENGQHIILE